VVGVGRLIGRRRVDEHPDQDGDQEAGRTGDVERPVPVEVLGDLGAGDVAGGAAEGQGEEEDREDPSAHFFREVVAQ
jgi:hypothetical protein